jgi:ABC-type lipoprotein export system ATPase subunit
VAHYLGKAPDLGEERLAQLAQLVANPRRIIKEAANSISAGIFIAHGHASIYGSDIQNWEDYPSEAAKLPELRLPVDSFEQFCLLVEKDASTINTLLNRKQGDQLVLQPFEDATKVTLTAFNDINVIFGPKGTGKTKILKAIASHYSNTGTEARVFESAPDSLADRFDLRGTSDLTKNLNPLGINYCTDEIKRLKAARESDITNLRKYRDYFTSQTANKNAKRIRIGDLAPAASAKSKADFVEYFDTYRKIREMQTFISESKPVASIAGAEKVARLSEQLSELAHGLRERSWEYFVGWKSSELMNSASRRFREEVARKTGTPSRPTGTGFAMFAKNRIQIKRNARAIATSLSSVIADDRQTVGSLGPDKGDLECVTSFRFQDGNLRDSNYVQVRKIIKKKVQTNFSQSVSKIRSNAFCDNLFDAISDLKGIEDINLIDTVYGLLLFWRRFSVAGDPYTPSNGECSMLNLHSELAGDKDVYLLDEPERSLGNEYINDVVIPLIRDKARQGKVIFISTHDANIAVRTLPYNSIYRCHDKNGYATFVGNPFSNNLVCIGEERRILDWKKISMKTLEGGEAAFGERGKIYGHR